MKPYDYSGKAHSNMTTVNKWADSCKRGDHVRRRPSRRAQAALHTNKRVAKRAARAANKRACAEEN